MQARTLPVPYAPPPKPYARWTDDESVAESDYQATRWETAHEWAAGSVGDERGAMANWEEHAEFAEAWVGEPI